MGAVCGFPSSVQSKRPDHVHRGVHNADARTGTGKELPRGLRDVLREGALWMISSDDDPFVAFNLSLVQFPLVGSHVRPLSPGNSESKHQQSGHASSLGDLQGHDGIQRSIVELHVHRDGCELYDWPMRSDVQLGLQFYSLQRIVCDEPVP